MNNISLKYLQTYLSVVETGSFRKASERLHLSQPAVTLHVKQIEQAVGVPLIDRTTRRMTVTPAGNRLRARAEQAVAELSSIVLELRDEAALRRGRISIGCVPTVAAHSLSKALVRFERDYPAITIKVHDIVAEQIFNRLLETQVDIGIGPRPIGRSEFDFRLVAQDPYVVVLSRTHPWATRKRVSIAALSHAPDFLALLPGSNVRETLDAAMASLSRRLVPKYEVEHHYTLGGMVEAGLGITALPSMAFSMLRQPMLQILPITKSPIVREIGIIKLRGKKLSPLAETFVRIFEEATAVTG